MSVLKKIFYLLSALTDSFQDNLSDIVHEFDAKKGSGYKPSIGIYGTIAPPAVLWEACPADYKGHQVPDILTSGNTPKVEQWCFWNCY